MTNALILAVGKLKGADVATNEALAQLIAIALRQRQALKFYADPTNYDGDAPQLIVDEDTKVADVGFIARYALEHTNVH